MVKLVKRDQWTVNWYGDAEVEIATRFRDLAGARGMSHILKQMVKTFVAHEGKPKQES